MSEYPRDEFDDVPETGARQGAHRGHNPKARSGSRRTFVAILVAGALALVLGAVAFVNAPRTSQDVRALPSAGTAVSPEGHVADVVPTGATAAIDILTGGTAASGVVLGAPAQACVGAGSAGNET